MLQKINQRKKKSYYSRKIEFIESRNKKVVLTNKEIYRTLGPIFLPEYEGKKVYYPDVVSNVAKYAI